MATTDPQDLNALVEQALAGSRDALDAIVRAVQHDVYGLSLRMLWHPADAADATQEILIKIVTRLGTFRGESAFRTWCYRVASNHLLNVRASRAEKRALSFESLAEQFAHDAAGAEPAALVDPATRADDALLVEEVKRGCTLGILLCLDRPHRLAYIVGAILGLSGDEGAEVCDAQPAAYRKRLERARARVHEFVAQHCGLVAPETAACRCARRASSLRAAGQLGPSERVLFARHPEAALIEPGSLLSRVRELESLHAVVQLYRAGHPDYAAPESIARAVRELLATRGPALLD